MKRNISHVENTSNADHCFPFMFTWNFQIWWGKNGQISLIFDEVKNGLVSSISFNWWGHKEESPESSKDED